MSNDNFNKLRNMRLGLPQKDICESTIILKGIKNDNARHAAAICFHNNPHNILAKGINTYNINTSKHAEFSAIYNLPKLPQRKKKIPIDIYVGRFGLNNNYLMSKPCDRCLNDMKQLIPKKGYQLIGIYYTGYDNTIIKTSLKILDEEEHYITKSDRRKLKL